MVEPRLGDVVINRDWPRGRIDVITEYDGVKVVGVKFEGSFLKQFFTVRQLVWQGDHWAVEDED
jgi:hypothetical protein